MKIEIPGYRTLEIEHLLLDYNGTIAEDGVIRRSVRDLLLLLSGRLDLHVLTADTHGTAKSECEGIPLHLDTFPTSDAASRKLAKLQELGLPAAPASATAAMISQCLPALLFP